MNDILQAARSYYGLADTESCTTQLFTNQAGQACVAFEIALSNEGFAAIVQRMQNMQQPDTQPDTAIIEGPTVEAMREAYNALSKAEKGRYGSFSNYLKEGSQGILEAKDNHLSLSELLTLVEERSGRQVIHVDAPEEPEPVSMDAVWLKQSDVDQDKWHFASDHKIGEDNEYMLLMNPAMLTDEQKQKAKESGK